MDHPAVTPTVRTNVTSHLLTHSSLKQKTFPPKSHPDKLHLLFLLIFFTVVAETSFSYAEEKPILRSIEIKGNKDFSNAEILRWLSLKPRLPFSNELLTAGIKQLLQRYREESYYSAAIDSVSMAPNKDGTEVDVVLYLYEGERTDLGALRLIGNSALTTKEVLSFFETREGGALDQSRLERDLSVLFQKYDEMGYPFAKVEIDSVSTYKNDGQRKLAVTLKIEEGAYTRIEEVRVEGNKDTKDDVILRELRIRPGEVYNGAKLREIKQKLDRLNLFSSVSEPELFIGPKGGGLLIKVQEGNTNSFDGIVGYVPKVTTNPSGYFTGFVSVSMRNLFGTGRRLAVRWQREDQETQEVELHYLEPWVMNLPVNAGIGFLQREQDSSYIRRTFDFRADILVTEELSIGILLGQERIIPSSTMAVPAVSESRTTTFGGEVRYDTRDDAYSPRSGIYYRSDYRVGRKAFSAASLPSLARPDESFVVKRLGVDLEFYFQPFSRQVVGTGLHAKDLRSDQIEDGDLFRFGGTNTLRGYRENQFLGSSIVWSNLEYRFLMARRSYLYGFMDTGYYFRPADDRRHIASSEALKVGYGIGFRVDTSLGLLGVSYALGRGDTFSTGKIHFGIINQF